MKRRKAKKSSKLNPETVNLIVAEMARRNEKAEEEHWDWVNSLNIVSELNGWQLCLQPQDHPEWLSIHVRSPEHRANNHKGICIGWNGERYANSKCGMDWLQDRYPRIAAWVDGWVQDGCPA